MVWIFRIFIAAIFIVPLGSYYLWYSQPVTLVDFAIVDKTVTQLERNEHKSFNWVLTYNNFRKRDSSLYRSKEDYYGFFPLEPIECKEYEIRDFEQMSLEQIDSISVMLDGVYFADMYGVYYNEWFLDSAVLEHSEKIYGGMSIEEVYMLEKMRDQGKLMFTEFNMLGSPTSWKVRKKAEGLLGIKWTGWTGRFFDSFDTAINKELPNWVIDLYTEQYDTTWHFTQSGIVLVHESEKIVILENGTDLNSATPIIYSSEYCKHRYKTANSVHYPFWFDITFPTTPANVTVAHYKIHATKRGDSLLALNRVPSEFPAVIEHSGSYSMYYFAGDFADNPFSDYTAYFKGVENVDILLYDGSTVSREKFFWKFYNPFVSNAVKQYLDKEKQEDEYHELLVAK